jgi:hypothetical protein
VLCARVAAFAAAAAMHGHADHFDGDGGVENSAHEAADADADPFRVAAARVGVGDGADETPERVAGQAEGDHDEHRPSEGLAKNEAEGVFVAAGRSSAAQSRERGESADDDVDDADGGVPEPREAFNHDGFVM